MATVGIDLSHMEADEQALSPLPDPPRSADASPPADLSEPGPDPDSALVSATEEPDAETRPETDPPVPDVQPDATVDLSRIDPGAVDQGAVEQRTTDLGSFIPPAPDATSPAADDSRPWIRQYAPGVPDSYRYPLVPLTRFLDDAAQDFPDTTALSFLGTQVTFREMATQVDRLAAAFTDLGLSGSDRLAVALPWTPQLVLTLHACWRLGVDVVVLDSEESPETIAEGIRETQPSAIIILDTLYGGLVEFRSQLSSVQHVIATGLLDALPVIKSKMQAIRLKVPTISLPESDGVLPFRAVLESASPVARQATFDVEDTTAATTVVGGTEYRASHHNVLAGAFQTRLWIPDMKAGREIVMVAGSPTDSFGLAAGVGLAMLGAATLVLPDPRSGGVARSIDTERPTILATTMDQVRTMLAPASKRRDLSSIRVTLARGVHFDPVVKDAAESRTAGRFRMAYAGAAVSGIAHAESIYADGMSNGAGLPVSDTVVECVDAMGEPLAHGTIGNLVASGPQVSGVRSPLGLVGSVDDAGYVTVVGATESVILHKGGASDVGVLRTALRRSTTVVEAEVRATTSGADIGLHAHVLVSEDTVTVDMLLGVLRDNAPAQSPPTEWTTEVVSASEERAEDPAEDAADMTAAEDNEMADGS